MTLAIEKLDESTNHICHRGHGSQHAFPCTERAVVTVNGIPFCARHSHEKLSAFGSNVPAPPKRQIIVPAKGEREEEVTAAERLAAAVFGE
jgi:hypothetical protein